MILLKNATVVNIDGITETDILIENGIVSKMGKGIESAYGVKEVDCDGKLVFPGFIDMHCHLREPGQTHKEDINSGSAAAVNGGYTAVCCMPNTTPPLDNAAMIRYVRERSNACGNAEVYPIGAITVGQGGKTLCEFGAMKEAGAIAVSDDGLPVSDGAVMLNALKYAKTFDMLVISHSEDKSISLGGVVNEGENAVESAAVARDVFLAEQADARIHIAHVSTANSIDIIRRAKQRGVKVTCETCPHYFSATDDEILSYNTNAKINPPLRSQSDVDAVVAGIADGTIDVIATDHAPHSFDEKNKEFDYAPFGTVGLETAFALAYTKLVRTEAIELTDLCRLMSYNPAKILGLDGGYIREGVRADITVIDPDEEITVDSSLFRSKGKNSLFDGWRLMGRIDKVYVGGEEKAI